MSDFRRRLMCKKSESELPSGYTKLDYLKSTGVQYIDTGVNAETGLKCELTTSYNYLNGNASILSAYDGNNRIYHAHISNPGKYWTLGYGNYYLSNVIPEANVKYKIDSELLYGYQNIAINNVSIISKAITANYDLKLNLFVFAMNKIGIANNFSSAKVFDLKIYKDNTIVRNFVPALDTANKPCLYDTVSKKPFYNQGTGEFLYG